MRREPGRLDLTTIVPASAQKFHTNNATLAQRLALKITRGTVHGKISARRRRGEEARRRTQS